MSVVGEYGRAGHDALKVGCDLEALECFRLAYSYRSTLPIPALVYEGLALAYRNLGSIADANEILSEGLYHYPGHGSMRLIRSLLFLGMGAWSDAWPDYEARFLSPQHCYAPRTINFRRWAGKETLQNKSLLIWGEQGLGDEIMFSTLYDHMISSAKDVYLECSPRLEQLFRRNFPYARVVAREPDGGMSGSLMNAQIDYEIPAGSLPLTLGLTMEKLETIRAHGVMLRAGEDKVAIAREIFEKLAVGRRIVGISWRGGTDQTRRNARSLTSSQRALLFHSLGDVCCFISLQHDEIYGEYPFGCSVHNLDHLAAMVKACDEVVTVCNTNVHLAGALNVPCTVLAPYSPEWRYGYTGEFVPWYDSVRVLRQPNYGNWTPVLKQVIKELRERAV